MVENSITIFCLPRKGISLFILTGESYEVASQMQVSVHHWIICMIAPLFLTLRLETYLHSLNLQVAVLIILYFREALTKLLFVHYPYQLQYVIQPESYKRFQVCLSYFL